MDEMTLLVELVNESVNRALLKAKLERDMEELLNVKGEVEFVERGVIFDKHKKIEDRRKWD